MGFAQQKQGIAIDVLTIESLSCASLPLVRTDQVPSIIEGLCNESGRDDAAHSATRPLLHSRIPTRNPPGPAKVIKGTARFRHVLTWAVARASLSAALQARPCGAPRLGHAQHHAC